MTIYRFGNGGGGPEGGLPGSAGGGPAGGREGGMGGGAPRLGGGGILEGVPGATGVLAPPVGVEVPDDCCDDPRRISAGLFAEIGGIGGGGIADLSREPDDEDDDDEDGVIFALTGGGGGSGADETAAGRDSAKSTRLPVDIETGSSSVAELLLAKMSKKPALALSLEVFVAAGSLQAAAAG